MQNEKGYDLVGKKLMLGLPAYDHKVGLKMAVSLMHLGQMVLQHGIQLQVNSVCGCSVVSRARNLIVKEFLKSDCDSLMFIDSDMTFTPESVIRLLAFNQDRPIVAGAYEARKQGKVYILSLEGEGMRDIKMDAMGLVQARRVATGFMMIRRDVFTKLAEAHPEWKHNDLDSDDQMYSFFDFKVTPEGYVGEDFLFCDRARAIGLNAWIDPTIKLGHMGIHEFQSDFANDVLYPMLKPIDATASAA